MPLARIDLIKGKSPEYRKTIGDVVYTAMVEILKAPEGDRFQVISEHAAADFIFDPHFFNVSSAPMTRKIDKFARAHNFRQPAK